MSVPMIGRAQSVRAGALEAKKRSELKKEQCCAFFMHALCMQAHIRKWLTPARLLEPDCMGRGAVVGCTSRERRGNVRWLMLDRLYLLSCSR